MPNRYYLYRQDPPLMRVQTWEVYHMIIIPARVGGRYTVIKLPNGCSTFGMPSKGTQCIVDMPADTQVVLLGIPWDMRDFCRATENEAAAFVRTDRGYTADEGCFELTENGMRVSLFQCVNEGITVFVGTRVQAGLPEKPERQAVFASRTDVLQSLDIWKNK